MLIDLIEPAEAFGLRTAVVAVQALLDRLAEDPLPDDPLELWVHGRPAAVKEAVAAIGKLDAQLRSKIAEEFAHDVRFSDSMDDPQFQFRLLALPDEAADPAKALLIAMYEKVLKGSGFELADSSKLTAKSLETAFREQNNVSVCPACLISTLELDTGGSRLYDLEHAFPSSLYPALAVHHHNLVPACVPCNQREHGDDDPLVPAGASLATAYVPYRRAAADELRVQFEPLATRTYRVELHGTDTDSDRRVRTHVRLYNLDVRWSRRIEAIHSHIREDVLDAEPATAEDIKHELLRLAKRLRRRTRTTGDALLEAEYCHWLATQDLATFAREVLTPPGADPSGNVQTSAVDGP